MGCINNKMGKNNHSSEKQSETPPKKDSKVVVAFESPESLPQRHILVQTNSEKQSKTPPKKDSKVVVAFESPKKLPQRHILVQTALKTLEQQHGFRKMKDLGDGSFGDVYLMSDRNHERSIAVKIVNSEDIDESETVLWPKLDHENVLPLLEFLPLGGVGAFIMDAQAGSLDDAMDKEFRMGPHALDGVKTWLRDIVCGLEYLHSKDLCHLDLKVDNILISHSSRALLCDFTFLRRSTEPIFRKHAVGMPHAYQPPEACDCNECRKSDGRVEIHGKSVDSWGLGMMTVRILTCYYNISARGKCWIVGVYPILFEMLQEEKFSSLMQCTLPNSNLSDSEEVELALNFIYGFLRLDPNKRMSASEAAQHPFLGQGKSGVLVPDDAWKQKLSMDSQEFQEYMEVLLKKEQDDSKNCIKAVEKDPLGDLINEVCSSITREAFGSLGQDILSYCPNKYVITPEDIENITKNTVALIKWPSLTLNYVISSPTNPNEQGEHVDAKCIEQGEHVDVKCIEQGEHVDVKCIEQGEHVDVKCIEQGEHVDVKCIEQGEHVDVKCIEQGEHVDVKCIEQGEHVDVKCIEQGEHVDVKCIEQVEHVDVKSIEQGERVDVECIEGNPTKRTSSLVVKTSESLTEIEVITSSKIPGRGRRVVRWIRSKFVKVRKFVRGVTRKDSQ
ncbi:hypothetical protein JTE90_003869 [Oedothorax gibbosus]|uniref:mitogen-activated protein kinase kinase n=1 Tax=Oedothorax gibbosus TaxID=931172 RepID=A0AAV6UIE5_9ARAC|nr:hypothetical protein JTE90_003869 [Oedothorax gibbosus]